MAYRSEYAEWLEEREQVARRLERPLAWHLWETAKLCLIAIAVVVAAVLAKGLFG